MDLLCSSWVAWSTLHGVEEIPVARELAGISRIIIMIDQKVPGDGLSPPEMIGMRMRDNKRFHIGTMMALAFQIRQQGIVIIT